MFGSGLGRFLPPFARSVVARIADGLDEVRRPAKPLARDRRRSFVGTDVVVAGLFSVRSGLGRGAHLYTIDLEARGATVVRVDLARTLGLPVDREPDDALQPSRVTGLVDVTDVVLIVNPPAFRRALLAFDRNWLDDRCIVAHWVWELDRLPKSWKRAAQACDEIWAASSFVARTIRAEIPDFDRPIKIVPYPVDRDGFPPVTADQEVAARRELNLSADTFCIGYSFSAASNYTRKNPDAAVEAFRRAFPCGRTDVALILRALDLDAFPPGADRLKAAAQADARIHIFDGRERSLPLSAFYAAIDLYVAPFRSEGYGLNLVEAAQAGRPVLATGWSLDDEILGRIGLETVPYTLVPVRDPQGQYAGSLGARWAEPDTDALKDRLQELHRVALARRQEQCKS